MTDHSVPPTVELVTRGPIEMREHSGWLLQMARANYTGDPLAEALVAEMRARRVAFKEPVPGIRRLAEDGNRACVAFLAEVDTVPDWVDFGLIAAGARGAARNMVPYLLALGLGSLPDTYLAPTSAEVLRGTRRFRANVQRRVYESAGLFHQVLLPSALEPGGEAWTTIVRLRLFHTLSRMQIQSRGRWNWDSVPISQAETAIGTQLFGSAPLERMDKLGAYMSRREKDGYYMLWRYVTYLLGAGELIFDDPDEQRQFERLLASAYFDEPSRRYNHRPDAAGKELTGDLLAALEGAGGNGIPRSLLEALLIRMQGRERAQALDVTATHHALRAAITITSEASRVLHTALWATPPIGDAVSRRALSVLGSAVTRGLAGDPPEYQVIPQPDDQHALV